MGNTNASIVDKWRTPSKLELLKCWARDFSLTDISAKMGITIQTLKAWRDRYPEIEEAISEGKEEVDYKVENALLKVALGYTTTDVKTIIGPPDKNGNRTARIEKTEKEIPPNPTAIMCWLNNRKPEQWKRNRDAYQMKDEDSKITVNIIRHGKDDSKDEDWNVSATKTSTKATAKKAAVTVPEEQDLDYWPDDWEDE